MGNRLLLNIGREESANINVEESLLYDVSNNDAGLGLVSI